jgi:LysR family transcriptional regulator (chromosome initiation inhibitor)
MRLNYDHLHAFSTVLREGSFAKAAQALHITQSAVSQRIAALEDILGHRILVREIPPRPTQSGRALLHHAQQVERWERGVLGELEGAQGESFSTFSVAVNADSLASWFLDAVVPALSKPTNLIHILVDDERHTDELLRRGEVSGCVSARAKAPVGCDSEYLGSMVYRLVATPKYRARYFKKGITRESLEQAPAVLFNRRDELHSEFLKGHLGMGDLLFPHHLVPSSQGFVSLVERGLAYGLVPEFQAADLLKRGILVELAPRERAVIKLHWQYTRLQPPFVREFSESIVKLGKGLLRQK